MTAQADVLITPEQVQRTLCQILAEALKLESSEIDIHMPFLEMGASSLVLVDVFRVVSETFGVRPSMRKVFDNYTNIKLLSGYIIELLQSQTAASGDDTENLVAASEKSAPQEFIQMPLTEMQKQIWFLARYSEGASSAYHETAILKLDGALDSQALQQVFQTVVNRHEALRTTLSLDEDSQRIASSVNFEVPLTDFSHFTAGELQQQVASWLANEGKRAFDMEKSLFRASVLKLHSNVHLLVVTGHALIVDKRSLTLVLSEVGSLYTEKMNGTPVKLEEPIQFRNYTELLKKQQLSPEFQEAEAYWLQQYRDGIPNLDLPLDAPRPAVKSYRGSRLVIPFDASLVSSLKTWSSQHSSTLFITFLAAFNVFLHRLTQQDDFVVGVFSQGGSLQANTEKLVANTINPLSLRTKIDDTLAFSEYLATLRSSVLNAFDRQDYPFASLIQKLNPDRDQSRSVMFTVSMDMEPPATLPQFGNLQVETVTTPIQYTRYDLSLSLVGSEENLQLQCDYSTDLLDSKTVRRWMLNFKTLIKAIAQGCADPIYKLPLLSEADYQKLLFEWNQTDKVYPQNLTIHELVEQQCEKTPGSTAIIFGQERWTYQQLNHRANQIARYLQVLGVQPGMMVGICLERSADLVAGLLAILKAGATYVPLDPAYPKQRLSFMLEDAGVSVLLTQAKLSSHLPEQSRAKIICIDTEASEIAKYQTDNLHQQVSPENLAYVIYTSGSTGTPKGVGIEHRSAVNFLFWAMETFDAQERSGVLFSTSVCFDLSIFELFFPLACGGKVIVADNALHLASLAAATEVTLINTVPSAIAELLRQNVIPNSVRSVNLAGEALANSLAQAVYNQTSVEKVYNLYGPTESTTYSTFTLIEKGATESTTIGRPVTNTKVYIVDKYLQPVPIGVAGELLLGGTGLARGYLNRPEATAEKFIANPFATPTNSRLYKTGDLVRYLEDGRIAYLGRIDHQVKIRGFRIELGEIESVLLNHSAVQETVVVAREGASGDKKLIAYLVINQDRSTTANELQMFLKEKLPEYMVPASFVILEQMPRTPNGKVDRKALPTPDSLNQMGLGNTYVPPRTPTEEILTHIWADVLGIERVGIHDDFFALGGHSLLMTPLTLKIRQMFQIKLSMREFFAEPTVAELAKKIDKLREEQAAAATTVNPQIYDQTGPAVQKRFQFLNQEALLDPTINSGGLVYELKPTADKIFLTGATGFVGVHVLQQFLKQSKADIYCLVRCTQPQEGKAKIIKSLKHFHLWDDSYESRILAVKGDLSQEGLGIAQNEWEFLSQDIDMIFHNGGAVNFIYPYQALKPINVNGTREIIKLGFKNKIKPVHFVSTVAIWPMGAHRVFANDSSIDHNLHLNMAYDETKWVGEKMLLQARDRGLPVTIYRPGEVSGHSETGMCIPQHFIYAILAGSIQMQAMPIANCLIDLTPVDYVAKAMSYLSLQPQSLGKAFHITNPSPIHSTQIYTWLRSVGYRFEELPLEDWRHKLMSSSNFAENALYPYAAVLEEFHEVHLNFPRFDCQQTLQALDGSLIQCSEVNEKLLSTYKDFFIRVGFLPEPQALLV
jgi:myxalamid-type nonribosomal peptide synthetase MxaA